MIHGTEEAEKAQAAARAIFGAGASDADMPSTALSADDLTDGAIGILDLMLRGGLIASNGEERRLVQQGGVSVDGEKVTDPATKITADQLSNGVVIKKVKRYSTSLHSNLKYLEISRCFYVIFNSKGVFFD